MVFHSTQRVVVRLLNNLPKWVRSHRIHSGPFHCSLSHSLAWFNESWQIQPDRHWDWSLEIRSQSINQPISKGSQGESHEADINAQWYLYWAKSECMGRTGIDRMEWSTRNHICNTADVQFLVQEFNRNSKMRKFFYRLEIREGNVQNTLMLILLVSSNYYCRSTKSCFMVKWYQYIVNLHGQHLENGAHHQSTVPVCIDCELLWSPCQTLQHMVQNQLPIVSWISFSLWYDDRYDLIKSFILFTAFTNQKLQKMSVCLTPCLHIIL